MRTIRAHYGLIILLCTLRASFTKPIMSEDKSFSEDSETVETDKSYQNPFAEYYRPRSRLESMPRLQNRPLGEYEFKRSSDTEDAAEETDAVQKRQVGVVYKDDKPIGILQPFQRSYRFIPVKEDNPLISDQEISAEIMQPLGNALEIDKREISKSLMDDSYPSILTSFKIDNKLDQKRADTGTYTEDQVKDLKNTIRKLRASNPERIESELKNILDDMGLIEDQEVRQTKREASEEDRLNEETSIVSEDEKRQTEERKKREPQSAEANTGEKKIKTQRSFYNKPEQFDDVTEQPAAEGRKRRKRQKETDDAELVENLKGSGELTFSGNKSPLASSSDSDLTDRVNREEDYDKKVERQIQNKIDNLKEEVKREIEKMKKIQEDDRQRKKRQVAVNLVDEETDAVNPIKDNDVELKPLIRKRRHVDAMSNVTTLRPHVRKKRDTGEDYEPRKKRSNHIYNHQQQEEFNKLLRETEDGAEILGDDFDDVRSLSKRNAAEDDAEYEMEEGNLNKRSEVYEEPSAVDYLYDDKINKRQIDDDEEFQEDFSSGNRYRGGKGLTSRFRRALMNNNGNSMNRAQQLSDMSDIDLFGALPKSYNGELTRYKRVKK